MSEAAGKGCQLHNWARLHEPSGSLEAAWQFRNRLRRMIKRRVRYLGSIVSEVVRGREAAQGAGGAEALTVPLVPGNVVRVRSRGDIEAVLDRWNRTGGCSFMEEMWEYCGTTHKVLKKVERFLDERDYRIKKCRRLVILEGVNCRGTVDYGVCDRSCYFFWREEWLEKVG